MDFQRYPSTRHEMLALRNYIETIYECKKPKLKRSLTMTHMNKIIATMIAASFQLVQQRLHNRHQR